MKIDFNQAIQTTANLGVLAGIFFLAYEIRQNTTATQLTAAESHLAAVIGQNNLIVENPQVADIVARVIAGEDISMSESVQLFYLFYSRLLAWQNSYLQYAEGAISDSVMRGFNQTMLDWMDRLPPFRPYWENRKHRFTPEFVLYVNSVLAADAQERP